MSNSIFCSFILTILLISLLIQITEEKKVKLIQKNNNEIASHDWKEKYTQSNLLYSHSIENILLPNIGNGYISTFIGNPQLYIAGVFNGYLNINPSHRASVPSPLNISISLPSNETSLKIENIGFALDIESAVFMHRSLIISSTPSTEFLFSDQNDNNDGSIHGDEDDDGNNNDNNNDDDVKLFFVKKDDKMRNQMFEIKAEIEERWYAHQTYRSLFVYEIEIKNHDSSEAITVVLNNEFDYTNTSDFLFHKLENSIDENVLLINGSILQSETNSSQYVVVSMCTPILPSSITVPPISSLTSYYLTTIRTDLDGDSQSPSVDVQIDYKTYQYEETQLFNLHKQSWKSIWQSGGIEIESNQYLAQIVNSSQYWILSSIRSDWEWGLSPGSLASNGYNGHSFWDTETWMYPHLLILHPSLARSALNYRYNHRSGAINKAKSYSPAYDGTMFPWESAFTGEEVCPEGVETCTNEQHISGDISFAAQQYFAATYDREWLSKIGLPLAVGIADFWRSRVLFNETYQQYVINDVCPPDEYHPDVNNSVYTNVVASMSLDFAIYASNYLNLSYPSSWSEISDNMRIPIDYEKFIHLEYDDYTMGTEIKQADVILLGFPLMYSMDSKMRTNDLNYYSGVTDPSGPAMTWSMTNIGYLEIGDSSTAASYFVEGYLNAQKPFLVWTETPTGGTVNFITGAGGFLQSVIFGYPSVRLQSDQLYFYGPVLPPNSTSLRIRNFDYLNSQFDYYYNSSVAQITLTQSDPRFPLFITYDGITSSEFFVRNFLSHENRSLLRYRKQKENPFTNSWKISDHYLNREKITNEDDASVVATYIPLQLNQPVNIPLPSSFIITTFAQ